MRHQFLSLSLSLSLALFFIFELDRKKNLFFFFFFFFFIKYVIILYCNKRGSPFFHVYVRACARAEIKRNKKKFHINF